MRNVLATSNVRQTYNENPSASCVSLICRYCGTYGITPPITMADAAAHPTTCSTLKFNSSLIIQSMVGLFRLQPTSRLLAVAWTNLPMHWICTDTDTEDLMRAQKSITKIDQIRYLMIFSFLIRYTFNVRIRICRCVDCVLFVSFCLRERWNGNFNVNQFDIL